MLPLVFPITNYILLLAPFKTNLLLLPTSTFYKRIYPYYKHRLQQNYFFPLLRRRLLHPHLLRRRPDHPRRRPDLLRRRRPQGLGLGSKKQEAVTS